MRLNKEEILFIDNYLSQAGMIYIDIRLEWVDHIATSIEAELDEEKSLVFYDVFKAFMVTHKKEILKTYEDQLQKVSNAVLLRFVKGFLKLDVLFLTLVLLGMVTSLEVLPIVNRYQEYLLIVPLGVAFLFVVLYLKGSRVSETRGLLVLSLLSFCGIHYYNNNPFVYFIIVLMILLTAVVGKAVMERLSEKILGWLFILGVFVSTLFLGSLDRWSQPFIDDSVRVMFFCLQLLFVYVLAKTAMQTLNNIRLKKKRISLIQ